jgi:hypothetical protein
VYAYDTANRLTKIEYNDGAGSPTILDGWEYGLADDGNITDMVSLTSAQGWTYAYDGKNRLQSAVRTNSAGQPQFREEYTYDAGDNMLTKQNLVFDLASSISDDFDDGDYTAGPAWTVASGSWAVEPTSLFLMNTGTTADSIWTANTKTDVEFFGPYMLDTVNDPANNYLEFVLRYSSGGTDQVSVRVYEGKMQLRKVVGGVATTVDFNDVDSPAGDAFGLWARCIGSTLQVLRAAEGTGWRVVAEMTGVPTTATTRVYLNTSGDMTAFVNDINYFAHKTTADSFADDFTASTLGGGWTATGSYSVVGNTLNGTNAAGYATVSRANTSADNQLKVSLKKTSSLNSIRLYVRSQDSNHQVWVETWGTAMQIVQRSGGVNTTLASTSVTTTLNTWYDYHVISDGNRIEVWRGPQGGTTELLLETDAATILGSAAMVLETRLCTASSSSPTTPPRRPWPTTARMNSPAASWAPSPPLTPTTSTGARSPRRTAPTRPNISGSRETSSSNTKATSPVKKMSLSSTTDLASAG